MKYAMPELSPGADPDTRHISSKVDKTLISEPAFSMNFFTTALPLLNFLHGFEEFFNF